MVVAETKSTISPQICGCTSVVEVNEMSPDACLQFCVHYIIL